MTNQELVNLLASAVESEFSDESYKSMQQLVRIIASCVELDEDGNAVIRVKSVDD